MSQTRGGGYGRVAAQILDRCTSLKDLWFCSGTLATVDLSDSHRGIRLSSEQNPEWIVYKA